MTDSAHTISRTDERAAPNSGFTSNWLRGNISRSGRRRLLAILRMAYAVLGMSRKRMGLGGLGAGQGAAVLTAVGVTSLGATAKVRLRACILSGTALGVLMLAAQPAQAALPLVSACTGASLPPSRLTGVLTPLVTGIFGGPIGVFFGPGLLAGVPGIVSGAVSGAPIGLDVLTTTGGVLAPGSQCVQQADGFSIATPKGITIGGNSIDGLGANGLSANAGEIGSIALGNSASTAAAATNSIALGTGATVTGTSPNAIAIGNGASATTSGGVALGGGSVDKAATATAGTTLNGTAYAFAGATPGSVVSVGAAGAERQIANVAAGQITAASTDAVNGSQLFATNTALNAIGVTAGNSLQYDNPAHTIVTLGGVGDKTTVALTNVSPGALNATSTDAVNGSQLFAAETHYYSVNDGGTPQGNYNNNGATGLYALAAGVGASASGGSSVAVGQAASAASADDVAMGANANANSLGTGVGAVAIGGASPGFLAGFNTNSAARGSVAVGFGSNALPTTGDKQGGVALGTFAQANVGAYNIAVGYKAAANAGGGFGDGAWATAIGAFSTATQNGATVVGSLSHATGLESFAAGFLDTASADQTIAIGSSDVASAVGSIAIGTGNNVSGAHSTAIGDPNIVTGAGDGVLGNNNTVNANNAFVLGNNVTIGAGLDGSVALGDSSTVAAPVPTASGVINGTTYAYAGGSAGVVSAVSVGSVGHERQIQNVAAGQITAASTDAVNGSQLFATDAALNAIGVTAGNGVQYDNPAHTSVTLGGVGDKTTVALTNVSPGALNATSTDAVNGSQLFTTNANVTTLGGVTTNLGNTVAANFGGGSTYNTVTGAVTAPTYIVQGSTFNNVGSALGAVDTNLTTLNTDINNINNGGGIKYFHANSTGVDSLATGTDSVAIGTGAVATDANDVALGAGSVTAAANPTPAGVIDGVTYTYAGGAPTSVVSVGALGAERQITNVAAGRVTATSTDAVNGSQLYATDLALSAIGATANNAVQYDNLAHTSVTLGGVGAAAPVALHNVAPGSLAATSTDAVNGSQLNAGLSSVATNLGGGSTFNPATGTVTAPSYTVNGNTYNNVGSALGGVDTSITNLTNGTAGLVQQTGGAPGAGQITVGAATGGVSINVAGTDGNRVISGVADGVNAHDAVTVEQLQATLGADQFNEVIYDNAAKSHLTLGGAVSTDGGVTGGTTISNLHQGALSATSTDAVNGSQLYTTNLNVTALTNGTAGPFRSDNTAGAAAPSASGANSTAGGFGALASGAGSVALGNSARSTGTNSVALGNGSSDGGVANVVSLGSPGHERTLTNVAPGVNGTDGVNVNQLVASSAQFRNGLNQINLEAQAGTALSLAASGLHYDGRPGTTSIAGAASGYASHAGIAFGLGHTSDNGNLRYNIAASFATPSDHADVGVVAGFSYTFGH